MASVLLLVRHNGSERGKDIKAAWKSYSLRVLPPYTACCESLMDMFNVSVCGTEANGDS